jgi:hypothetical protein
LNPPGKSSDKRQITFERGKSGSTVKITIETPLFTCLLDIDLADEHFLFLHRIASQAKVTGAPSQTISFAEDFGKAVQKLIQTKTIAALGMVTPGSTTLQYLF